MTLYLENTIRYLLRLTVITLILIVTLPYLLMLIGMIGVTLIFVSAFIVVPFFFICTMLSGKDYKDKDYE